MRRFILAALLTLPLFGASLVIDCGAPSDQYFTGGTAYTIQPASDTTLRFGTFSYKVPVDNVPYVVKFTFLEPSSVPPARAFSVSINDQLIFPRLTMQGFAVPFTRSFVAVGADGFLTIRFDTIVRSAVVSSIEITPLFQIFSMPLPGPSAEGQVPVTAGFGRMVIGPASGDQAFTVDASQIKQHEPCTPAGGMVPNYLCAPGPELSDQWRWYRAVFMIW